MNALKVQQVCERTTVSRTTLWRMVRDGQFPKPFNLSAARIAWYEADVDKWLASKSQCGNERGNDSQ